MIKERYAYVSLALLSVVCAVIAVFVSVTYVRDSNRNFCEVTDAATKTVVVRPTLPKDHQSEELAWEWYERFHRLDMKLGC